jgi:hypothetical protein
MGGSKPSLMLYMVALVFVTGIVVVGVVLTVSKSRRSESAAFEELVLEEETAPPRRSRPESSRPTEKRASQPLLASQVPPELLPQASEAELAAMIPDEHGLAEIQRRDFKSLGGIESPGADPERARREVNDPGWIDRFEQELRQGLSEMVLVGGEEISRVECERGRCLVELRFEDMQIGLERVGALRQWLTDRVPCRAYTEGPVEGDSPSIVPEQQIWILCGEPSE